MLDPDFIPINGKIQEFQENFMTMLFGIKIELYTENFSSLRTVWAEILKEVIRDVVYFLSSISPPAQRVGG